VWMCSELVLRSVCVDVFRAGTEICLCGCVQSWYGDLSVWVCSELVWRSVCVGVFRAGTGICLCGCVQSWYWDLSVWVCSELVLRSVCVGVFRAGTEIVSRAARDRVQHYLNSLKQYFAGYFSMSSSLCLSLYVPICKNRVLGASPPDISPLESLLSRSVRTTLAQLRSGHCRLLNSYKAHITSGISDVCHTTLRRTSVQLSKPSDTTYSASLWDNPAAVADFLNLDN